MNAVVIVALPLGDRQATYADGDTAPVHQTLIYLGDISTVTPYEAAKINVEVGVIAEAMTPAIAKVSGKGTLGPEQERIILTESVDINVIREQLMENPIIQEVMWRAPQHPNWIPHITGMQNLVYGDQIVFNRLAVWYGVERTTHPIGGTKVILNED